MHFFYEFVRQYFLFIDLFHTFIDYNFKYTLPMKKITLLLFLLLSIVSYAQNGGDSCAEAVSIPSGSFSNVSITQNTQGGEQGTAQPRDASWYVFTSEEDGLLSLSSCTSSTDTRVFVGTGTCGSLETQAQSDDSCGLQSQITNLAVSAGVAYFIEWDDRWSTAAFSWELLFIPSSACQPPNSLAVGDITSTSAVLSWEEAAPSYTYEWVIMTLGEDPNDPITTPVAFGTTAAGIVTAEAMGLESDLTYDAFVRTLCDTDESVYTEAVTFTTNCEIFIPTYLESFNEGTVPPDCWIEASNGTPDEGPMNIGGGSWRADDYLNDEVLSGGMDNAARINLFFNLEQDWLISPTFDLSGGDFELVYNVAVTDFGNQDPSEMGSDDAVQVLISTDQGASWETLVTYNTSNTPSHLGQEEIIDLSSFNSTALFAFWATDGLVNDLEDYDFFIDEFQVRLPLNCTVPEIVYTEIPDCDTDQYSIGIEVVSLGTAPFLMINDDFGNAEQIADASGSTFVRGPYPSGTAVLLTVTGDDEACTTTQNIQFSCPPSNDLCFDAVALTTGINFQDQAVTTTNVNATDSGAIAPICANYDGGDLWFTAVIPDDGILTLETNAAEGSVLDDTGMEVYMGTCDALVPIECDDDDSADGLFSLITVNDSALAGQTIFVRVWEWSNDTFGAFQIAAYNENFEMPCVAPEVTVSTVNSCEDGTFSVAILINSLGSAPTLTITDNQGSEPQIASAVDTVIVVGPYESGLDVEIVVTGDDEACTLTQVASFTCPPENDACVSAIPLITGVDFPAEAITATTAGASDSGVFDPSCVSYNGGDVWFTATVPSSGFLNIETRSVAQSMLTDTALAVYTNACDAPVQIACDDNSAEDGAFSLITLSDPALGGDTIFIRAFNPPNDSEGIFQISVYNENILNLNDTGIPVIDLYPNPAQTDLTIIGAPATATIFVTNILGQSVLSVSSDTFSVRDLQDGIYFVTIQEASTSQTLRFIKN